MRHAFSLLLLITLLAAALTAQAHANLVRSQPAANTTIDDAPVEIRLWFSEAVEPSYSRITLRDTEGETVATSPAYIDADDPRQLILEPRELPEGLYTVAWRVVSAVDGHPTQGSFVFGVRVPVTDVELPPVEEDVSAAGVVIRWLDLMSMALVVGGVGFRLLVWFPAGIVTLPDGERRLMRFIRLGWIALGLTGLLSLLLQTAIAEAVMLSAALNVSALAGVASGTQYGMLWLARMALWLLLGGALLIARRDERGLWAALGFGAALLLTRSLFSHAGTVQDAFAAIAADWLHLLATALWLGGLTAFALALITARRLDDSTAPVSRLTAHFSNYARVAIAALIVTGAYAAWLQIGTVDGLTGTVYGQALLVKLGLFLPLLGIAAVNLVLTQRRLRQRRHVWVGRLRGLIGAEIVLAVGILVAVGVMTSGTPARSTLALQQARDAARRDTAQITWENTDDLHVHLEAQPGRIGANTFRLYLFDLDSGAPVADATLIRMRFDHMEQNLGQSELRPELQDGGAYVAEGANLSVPGDWRVRLTIQRPERFDTVVDLPLRAEPPPPAPSVDTSIPDRDRLLAAALTGIALLGVGGFTLAGSSRRSSGPALLAVVAILVGGVLLIAAVRLIGPADENAGGIAVGEVWALPAMQGRPGAVYLTLTNRSGRAVRLNEAETDIAEVVEIHRTVMTEDIMQMQPLEQLELPADAAARLEPGGDHLMLIDLRRDLDAGDTFALTLRFDDGTEIVVEAQVRAE
jgi:copper transport protein